MKIIKDFYDSETGRPIYYTERDRYEFILEDWATRNKKDDLRRYKRYFKGFGIKPSDFKDKEVMEVGTGAWGGVLRFLKHTITRIAIDPLIGCYRTLDIYDFDGSSLCNDAKHIPLSSSSIDVAFCLNTLDHCDDYKSPQKIINEICRVLKKHGKFYVHLHLRDDDKINLMHLYAFETKDLEQHFKNFNVINWRVDNRCFVWDRPFKTFWGVFEK